MITYKYGALVSLIGAGIHFGSHVYVDLEARAIEHLTQQRNEIVDLAAKRLGYERPQIPIEVREKDRRSLVVEESQRRRINPALSAALIKVESAGNPLAVSSAGAIGLMQIMPANIRRCGLEHPGRLYDEEANITCGVQILAEEMTRYQDVTEALYSYNGGPKAVDQIRKCGTRSKTCLGGYVESVQYAQRVLRVLAQADGAADAKKGG